MHSRLTTLSPQRLYRTALPGWLLLAGGVLASGVLSGCATPQYQAPEPAPTLQASETEQQQRRSLQHRLAQQQRLIRVAWPLLTRNTTFCGERVKPALGLLYGNSHSFGPPVRNRQGSALPGSTLRDTALRTLQLGEALQVLSVIPGSAADHAGIQSGDRLVSIDGNAFQTGNNALSQAPQLFRQLKPEQPVKLIVYRQQHAVELNLTPVTACDYPLVLAGSDQVNAFADHRTIIITEGMLDFTADSDRDLALVIAHELAHNVLGHIPATTRNTLIGSSIDLLLLSQGIPSAGAFTLGAGTLHSSAFETEADYVSLYLLARSGYPLEGIGQFWRRMSQSRPGHINAETDPTHPGTADRYLVIDATIDEIEQKLRQRQPLVPNAR